MENLPFGHIGQSDVIVHMSKEKEAFGVKFHSKKVWYLLYPSLEFEKIVKIFYWVFSPCAQKVGFQDPVTNVWALTFHSLQLTKINGISGHNSLFNTMKLYWYS